MIAAAALAYAATGWPVFPCQWRGDHRKEPLTPHGFKDATIVAATVADWWRRRPRALIGTPTGLGFVVLDIDPRHGGDKTIAALGFVSLPATPTTRTAGGGWHLYFAAPDPPIHNTAGARGRGIGPGLDWRGVGGYVILPSPGSGYEWVGPTRELPMVAVPLALLPTQTAAAATAIIGTPATCTQLSDYGEAALRSAAEKIMTAPAGQQEVTLNGEAYAIGRLAGAGGVPADLALEILQIAARKMPSYDRSDPWQADKVNDKVERAFRQGLAKPRPDLDEVMREIDRQLGEANEIDWTPADV